MLPEPQYRFTDLPPTHPMFHTSSRLTKVPQIPGISYWWRSGGDTSEQGADSAEVHVRAISDEHGRLMVLSTHNTDIADGWEREGVDPRYFQSSRSTRTPWASTSAVLDDALSATATRLSRQRASSGSSFYDWRFARSFVEVSVERPPASASTPAAGPAP